MWKLFSDFRVSSFRSKVLVWIMLTVFVWPFLPSVSFAQQPTATISAVSGTVLVNGQQADKGTKLSAGSVIETQADATVVLELSDGSLVELGENTKLDLAVLSQTATGGRVSRIKLLWGRIRAKLSPGHQQAGSSFDIATPNATIGVKFSQPDIEVSYDPEKQETIALALTVALAVKNLITDEEKMIPIGSMAVITALGIKVMAGALATGTIAAEATGAGTSAGGMSTGKMVAIGAGAAAAVGGIAAMAGGSSGSGGDGSSSGGSSINVVGRWSLLRDFYGTPDPDGASTIEFYADYSVTDLTEGYTGSWSLQGNQISFTQVIPPDRWFGVTTQTFTGTITGDSMQGLWQEEEEGDPFVFSGMAWSATRL